MEGQRVGSDDKDVTPLNGSEDLVWSLSRSLKQTAWFECQEVGKGDGGETSFRVDFYFYF